MKLMPTALDDIQTTNSHADIIRKKYAINKIYSEYYEYFKKIIEDIHPEGKVLELGSGGGFIKRIIPEAITSDVVSLENCDKVIFAEKLPFDDNFLKAILMIDVLHHVKQPHLFFREAIRCLVPEGKVIMVEPSNTFWASIIWRFFHHEDYDERAGWELKGSGRLSSANSALPWIIFNRDRKIFEKEFPDLKILSINLHTPFAYLLSGGMKKWSLLNKDLYYLIRLIEKTIEAIKINQGLFQTIVLQKGVKEEKI